MPQLAVRPSVRFPRPRGDEPLNDKDVWPDMSFSPPTRG